jgi:hypothetical protein
MYLYVYLKVMGHCPLFYNKLTLGYISIWLLYLAYNNNFVCVKEIQSAINVTFILINIKQSYNNDIPAFYIGVYSINFQNFHDCTNAIMIYIMP